MQNHTVWLLKPKNPTEKNSTTKSNNRAEMDAKIVCIDQTKKPVQVEPRAAWFPRCTRPSVELSSQSDWTCLFGAILEDSECFFSQFTECVTADQAKNSSYIL